MIEIYSFKSNSQVCEFKKTLKKFGIEFTVTSNSNSITPELIQKLLTGSKNGFDDIIKNGSYKKSFKKMLMKDPDMTTSELIDFIANHTGYLKNIFVYLPRYGTTLSGLHTDNIITVLRYCGIYRSTKESINDLIVKVWNTESEEKNGDD